MKSDTATVLMLGTRGTIAVEGPEVAHYGGATMCILVRLGGETIVLDGGTGLMSLDRYLGAEEREVRLLLSHPHADHMAGLTSCPVFYDPARRVTLYAAPHGGLSVRGQVERLMSPPLWPVGPEAFGPGVSFCDIAGDFMLGPVRVRVMEGAHPGGCTVYRLEHGGKSLVYATDYELGEESGARLCAFAKNCNLLLCDGQYTEEEIAQRRGYGHSDWSSAAQLAGRCGAQRLVILHHAPWREDAELDQAGPKLKNLFANSAFARIGEELAL